MQDGMVDHTIFERTRQAEMDATLLVKFFTKPVKDKAASEREGRPVFKDKEYVDIRGPGSRSVVCRPASARDKARFSRHYEAFKARIDLPSEGTPLSEWPLLERTAIEELAYFNIKTVEQLANLSDGSAGAQRGFLTFKDRAQKWLARAKKDVSEEKLAAELSQRDRQIDELKAQVESLMAARPKPRSRRKKDADKPDDEC